MKISFFALIALLIIHLIFMYFEKFGFAVMCILLSGIPIGAMIGLFLIKE